MKKITTLLFICIFISSCAPKLYDVPLVRRIQNNPEKNTIIVKEIGESILIKTEEDYQKEAVKITKRPENIRINTVNFPYTLGTVLPLASETKGYFLYYDKKGIIETDGYTYSKYTGYVKTERKTIIGVAKSKKDINEVLPFIATQEGGFGGFYPKYVKDFEVEETDYSDINCDNCFKAELVYNGKSKNQIKIIYREYIENMARPAFTQELQYDLSESNIVGFKGARIEILEATNTTITYKILNDFN